MSRTGPADVKGNRGAKRRDRLGTRRSRTASAGRSTSHAVRKPSATAAVPDERRREEKGDQDHHERASAAEPPRELCPPEMKRVAQQDPPEQRIDAQVGGNEVLVLGMGRRHGGDAAECERDDSPGGNDE